MRRPSSIRFVLLVIAASMLTACADAATGPTAPTAQKVKAEGTNVACWGQGSQTC